MIISLLGEKSTLYFIYFLVLFFIGAYLGINTKNSKLEKIIMILWILSSLLFVISLGLYLEKRKRLSKPST